MVAHIIRQLSLCFLLLLPTGVDYDLGGIFFGRVCLRRSMVCSLSSERISYALYCVILRFIDRSSIPVAFLLVFDVFGVIFGGFSVLS
jgi:hypothetical protein